ncbi:CcmD family protein [Candidatus Amoebophilus asiaticus]|nr:CcmD family protein [Candidatus Amoebophilus asiaticus]
MKAIFLFLFIQIVLVDTANAENIFRQSGKIYVVVSVLVTIFLGIVIYLISIDKKISRIEKESEKEHS